MFLTPDLIQICLGNSWDTRQGKEAWFASSAEKGPKAATEQISSCICVTVKLLVRLRGETMHWQAHASTHITSVFLVFEVF